MASFWTAPKNISQSGELTTHIPWNSNLYSIRYDDGTRLSTTAPLSHIANSYAGDRLMKTYYLYAIGFNFKRWDYDKNTIAGIQLKLNSERSGRIVDDTIQLVLNGEVIGKNNANIEINQTKYYGVSTPWEITVNTTATNAIVQNSTFGVCIRFQSHPSWPHRESPSIEYLALRLLTEADVALLKSNDLNDFLIEDKGKGGGGGGGEGTGGGVGTGSSRDPNADTGNKRKTKVDGKDVDAVGTGNTGPGIGGEKDDSANGGYLGSYTGYTSSGGGIDYGSRGYVGSFVTSYIGSFVTHNYYTGSISNRTTFLPNATLISQLTNQWVGDLVGTFNDYQLYVWTGTAWILF